MAVTKITYTGNGSQTQFTIPFEYIAEADVDVYIDTVLQLQQNTTSTAAADHPQVVSGEITQGTALINYTFANATTIQFNSAPANGAFIFIERTTDDTSIVTFTPGSTIRAQELNSALEQVRFIAQEGTNTAQDGVVASKDNSASIDGQGKRLENLADANSDDDAVTRAQLGKVITDDLLEGEAIDLTDATGGSNSNKQVTISVEDSSKTNKGAVSINEGHAIGVTYTSGDAVIAADKSTASQQGVVKITTPSVTNGNPITLTRPADGEVELTIADGAIDVQKIKGLDKADTSEYASTWDNDDDQVATVGAIAKRLDAIVSTSQPTTAQVGKFWYNPTEGINALYLWNGTEWKVLTSGTPYIPAGTTIVRYVDAVNGSDDVSNTGFLPQSPLRTIKRALTLINASASGDGTLIVVEPGVYQEELPLRIEKNNISVVGKSLRSCFIHPTVATETSNMWEVDSGTYITGFTLLGLKVPTANQGSRNNPIDNDSTYGIPSNHPFAVSFRSGNPVILKSPYIQNCTHFSDAHFDNANFDPNTFQSTDAQTYSAVAGDQSSAPCGGGLLVDGSVPDQSSPIRSMVVDAFTQITLDAPGIIVTNNGYAQLVSFFGTFCHYHAKAKNGGQINLSNCVTDFGRFGLIAEGKSPTPIATATASAANSGATTVTIGAITTAGTFHGTVSRPLDHMMITIDGADYGVVSSTANGAGWDVTITPALASNISNTAVSFALRSYISTGGHTFEYVGVGTDYGSHPDNGGVAVEANQVKEFNGGKVWQSSTDHIGKFKAGNVLTVDQVSETVAVNGSITVTGTNAVNGNITVTGTVDGRNVATDGTKLDGIEAGATTDQTASEIKTAYESNSDTNAFTDTEKTKLSGIAAGAEENVNADWNATSGDAQILNKPSIPAAYGDSDVDDHLNQSTAATGEVLSWNGTDYDWVASASGGASAINDLSDAVTYDSGVSVGLGTGALTNSSGTSQNNTALGYNAGLDITSGSANVCLGYTAGRDITTANGNIAIGNALNNSAGVTGNYNVAAGDNSGEKLTTGNNNVFLGSNTGKHVTTGASNVYIGDGTADGSNVTTGISNTFIGRNAGKTNSASYGVCLGSRTGTNVSGDNNTIIGNEAQYNVGLTGTNNLILGANADSSSASVSNEITLGDANITSLRIPGLQSGATDGQVLTYNSTNGNITLAAAAGLSDNSTAATSLGVGTNALDSETSGGEDNTAFGYDAGTAITSGQDNTAIGLNALKSITTNDQCTAVGGAALQSQTGGNSTAVGYNAGVFQTTGTLNTYVGWYAGLGSGTTSGSSNTYLGAMSGYSSASGGNNVGIGYQALYNNTTGAVNHCIGYHSGRSNTAGTNNVFIGYKAGYSNTTQSVNCYIGDNAGYYALGDGNVAIGYQALAGNSSATANRYNVAVGNHAGEDVTSGYDNTLIGWSAGSEITTGYNLIVIGKSAAPSSNTANEEVTLGNSSISTLRCNTQTISSLSDGRDKTEVEDLPLGLDFIDTLRPVKFKWDTRDGNGKDGTYDAGFIAQDLQSAQSNSDAEYLKMVMDSNPDRLEAAYGQLIPVLVQAIKDLKSEIETLKSNA